MTGQNQRVTAVIPTIGRASLTASIESALAQREVDLEVTVIADRPKGRIESIGLLHDFEGRVQVRWTGGGKGGSYARQLGTAEATTPWVAYLDDDDLWLAGKLRRQLDEANTRPDPLRCVVSCQSRSVDTATGQTQEPIPAIVYDGSEALARWLFHRRRLSAKRALMPTPTLLVPTDLARAAGWRRLPRHQDWDFVLRLAALDEVEILQVPEILVQFAVGSPSSISSEARWEASLAWAESMRNSWDEATYADFVAGQPLRYALQGRDLRGVTTVLRSLPRTRLPTGRAMVLAASGLGGRDLFDRALHRDRGASG